MAGTNMAGQILTKGLTMQGLTWQIFTTIGICVAGNNMADIHTQGFTW
jgi:hypothetical protein